MSLFSTNHKAPLDHLKTKIRPARNDLVGVFDYKSPCTVWVVYYLGPAGRGAYNQRSPSCVNEFGRPAGREHVKIELNQMGSDHRRYNIELIF